MVFQRFSLSRMVCATAMIWEGFSKLKGFLAIFLIGNSLLTAHQDISKPSYCTIQTSAPPFLWLSADERELRERQNSVECSQVCSIQLGNFKMVAFLMGLQGGFTKFPCYLCFWDCRNTSLYHKKRNWPPRSSYNFGTYNVKQTLLASVCEEVEPRNGCVQALSRVVPEVVRGKDQRWSFCGSSSEALIRAVERRFWKSFVSVTEGFLGNHMADIFREIMEELVDAYEKMGCRMSLKLHVLHSHIDEFKDNMGDCSEEQGERFHQDVKLFEEHYKGQYNESIMGNYIWNLVRESELTYNWQSQKKLLFNQIVMYDD